MSHSDHSHRPNPVGATLAIGRSGKRGCADAGRDKPVPYGLPGRREAPRRGFSLVELLVVLVILGLLIGLVAPAFMGRAEKSRGDVAKVQIEWLHSALKTYHLDVGRYPSTENGLASLIEAPTEVADYWHGPYLDDELPLDPWRNPYQYRYPAENLQGLALYSLGADGAEGGEGDNADIGFLPTAGAE